MAVVTLLSDFVDGSSMALAEDTDAPTLNDYMTGSQGRLWAGVQQRRRQRGLTTTRRGPGTVYFAPDERSAAAVNRYLQSDTGSEAEALALAEFTGHRRGDRPPRGRGSRADRSSGWKTAGADGPGQSHWIRLTGTST